MYKLDNKFFYQFKKIFFTRSNASAFIWKTIIIQKKNLSLNLISGVSTALLEGISLGIV